MSEPYEEFFEGDILKRAAPGPRHELICSRLHHAVRTSVGNLTSTRLLERRSEIQISNNITIRPDLALITVATQRLWLAAEIVSSDDHRIDTVIKKQLYEELRLPRLWMIDPRYDNVEIYHASEYGLKLAHILAGREVLSEKLIPEFEITVCDLFAGV